MSKPSSTAGSGKAKFPALLKIVVLLAIVLCALFYQNFESGMVLFSNDGPLGQIMARQDHLPAGFTGYWVDMSSVGANAGSVTPNVSAAIKSFWEILFGDPMGPLGYLNTYTPVGLFIMGLGAWAFFRKLKLSPLAATLGALAVMLNTQLFSGACWGVASDQIALGFNFLALALICANDDEPGPVIFWTRYALAGLCVGVNVMEAADVGALCSLFIALYIVFKSLVDEGASVGVKIGRAIPRITMVAVLAGFIATQTVVSLVSTQLQGTSLGQSNKDSLQQWDYATQWSLPKQETLGIFVPGLFGYRMDTPLNTVPFLQSHYDGGQYWGGMGRDPSNDRYFDSGGKDSPPSGMMRFGYGGYYCGILVALLALWAMAQSFRRQNSPFTDVQKKFIWFWSVIILLSFLLAWGRFAPAFYGFLYHYVPHFSQMRNPAKFMFFIEWGLTVLFAYGVYGLQQRHLSDAPAVKTDVKDEDKFDQRSLFAGASLFAACVFAWLMYASEKAGLVQYLKYRGYPDDETARSIASFSIGQAGWFLLLFGIALVLLAVIINGYLAGGWRAKLAAALLGLFLVFDLGRADLPFIIHWNIKQKYEVGDLNPVIDYLRPQPYEHRVAILPQPPFNFPPECGILSGLYGIEWSQHLLPYYNIQSLDIIQMPRMPLDLMAYEQAFMPQSDSEAFFFVRWWQLTNTRYLLGPAGYLNTMNAQLDPAQQRFRTVMRFNIGLKPGIQDYNGDSSELTAYADTNGPDALIEFTGALPRVKLYTDWQTNTEAELNAFTTNNLSPLDSMMFGEAGTNGLVTLQKLESPFFDPEKTVLIDVPTGVNPPPSAAGADAGTVDFASYAPKHIVLDVNATAPAVLLLNDHYDPNWHVTIDGQPTQLFHANFIMQGIFVPAGKHTVEYQFSMPVKPLYVTITAIGVGIVLCGVLVFYKRPGTKPVRRF